MKPRLENKEILLLGALTHAAGPWYTRLFSDRCVYFCRALSPSEGTRFVLKAEMFYRNAPPSQLSHIGTSLKKKGPLLLSMKLQVQYVRSAEDSERVRRSCLPCMQNCLGDFYPERPHLVTELKALATQLGGAVNVSSMRPQYARLEPIVLRKVAKSPQIALPQAKASLLQCWDESMYRLRNRGGGASRGIDLDSVT